MIRRRRNLLLFGCCLLYVGQCLWFIETQSLVYDEPTHVIAGLDAWRYRRFEEWNDQPPLARLLMTLPLLPDADRWRLEQRVPPLAGNFWTVSVRPDPQRLAWRTRPVNVVLGLALLSLVWLNARRLWGEGGALFSAALFALSPPLVAHFSLATVDGAVTLSAFATASTLVAWRKRPSWPMTVALGAILGGFLLTKFSALPLVILAIAFMSARRSAGTLVRRLGKVAAALFIAVLVVWSGYLFRIGPVKFRSGSFHDPAALHTVIVPVHAPLDLTLTLPAPEFLPGLSLVTQHAVKGQPAFLLGEVSKSGGWRSYYPIVVALKWPLVVWALAGIGFVLAIRSGGEPRGELAILMTFPAVFFGLAIFSHLDLGDRYVLPVYSFLILLCAGVWPAVERQRYAIVLIGVVLTLQAVDVLRYAPDYLSYFNAFVRPSRSHELLTDSTLDWGQGLLALRRYAGAHPAERLRLAYFGGADPRDYGITAEPLAEGERATGTIVISATHLSGQYLADMNGYRWILKYPEVRVLNHTLHVFKVPPGAER